MNYIDKKKELMTKKDIVLAKYNDLFHETMKLTVDMAKLLDNSDSTLEQQLEWVQYMTFSEEADNIFRLAAALQYVKEPTDKEVVSTLIENIEVNNPKMKIKRM